MSDVLNHTMTTVDGRAALGFGWQDNGPVLRNSEPGALDDHFWRPAEIVVWIATRDERAIQGFNGYVDRDLRHSSEKGGQHSGSTNRGEYEAFRLNSDLVRDVADHHRNCPRFKFIGTCQCENLGRQRYCRCTDWQITRPRNCTCVPNAVQALLHAAQEGLPLLGRRPDAVEFIAVPTPALAGLELSNGEHGLQLLSSFPEIKVKKEDVLRRWPAGFAECPREAEALIPVSTQPQRGRPPGYEKALTIFCDRLGQVPAQTKQDRLKEMDVIYGRMDGLMQRESVIKAVRKFHDMILWSNGQPTNASVVISKVRAYLEAQRAKRVAAALKTR
jgi:hypothetical protein